MAVQIDPVAVGIFVLSTAVTGISWFSIRAAHTASKNAKAAIRDLQLQTERLNLQLIQNQKKIVPDLLTDETVSEDELSEVNLVDVPPQTWSGNPKDPINVTGQEVVTFPKPPEPIAVMIDVAIGTESVQ